MRKRSVLSATLLAALAAVPALAGFAGTDIFLPMVGRQAGIHPSNWYTTVWIHNAGTEAATARLYLLVRNTANPTPPWVDVMVGPGDTEKLENVVETYFHVQAFGAMRVSCPTKLVVTSRVYSQAAGAGEQESVGQDFAGVPASFAIGAGEKAQILGVHQTEPAADSEVRYNFGFVETTGHAVNLRVRAFDGNGADQGYKDLQVREWSQRQMAFKDWFPDVSTENSRLEVEVTSGAGRVIAYGSAISNGSQDPTTFEMTYPDALLAGAAVQHDASLTGDGTDAAPLGIAPSATAGQVLATVAGGGAVAGGASAAVAGNSVGWQSLGSLSLGLSPGGVTFGNASGALAQDAASLFWDAANKRLGIGLTNPRYPLDVAGNIRIATTSATAGKIVIGDYAFLHGFGIYNTFVGPSSGNWTMTGRDNTGVGAGALLHVTTASNNTAVGSGALHVVTTGGSNTAVGENGLYSNTEGTLNSALGTGSLFANTTGSSNTAVGASSLHSNTSGTNNTAVGQGSLQAATTASFNSAFGYQSMYANTSGSSNTAIGSTSLTSNTTGEANVAVGATALLASTTGSNNTAAGYGALRQSTGGNDSTAVGFQALNANTTAGGNTAVGSHSLESNTTGTSNVAVGLQSLSHNTIGNASTGVGSRALASAAGSSNAAVGADALFTVSDGAANTAVGSSAGYSVLGSGNVFLGYQAGFFEVGSNRLHIANSSVSTLIYGQFDSKRVAINSTSPTDTLDVNGSARVRNLAGSGVRPIAVDANGVLMVSVPSDERLKKDIVPLSESIDVLAALAGLHGVNYVWDTSQERVKGFGNRREVGLLAQDVEKVMPEVVSTDAEGFRSVDYARLTALLVEVAKAQQREIEALKSEVAALRR